MTPRHVLAVCAAALAAMLLFPPWVWTDVGPTRVTAHSAGYAPVWDPSNTTVAEYRTGVMTPDYPRLGVQALALLALGAAGLLLAQRTAGPVSRPSPVSQGSSAP